MHLLKVKTPGQMSNVIVGRFKEREEDFLNFTD